MLCLLGMCKLINKKKQKTKLVNVILLSVNSVEIQYYNCSVLNFNIFFVKHFNLRIRLKKKKKKYILLFP